MNIHRTAIIAVAAAALAATGSASQLPTGRPSARSRTTSFDARDKGFDVMPAGTDGSDVTNIPHDGTATERRALVGGLDEGRGYTSYTRIRRSRHRRRQRDLQGAHEHHRPVRSPGSPGRPPTWAPDGSIVYASDRDGNFGLYRIGGPTDRGGPNDEHSGVHFTTRSRLLG